MLVLSTGEQGLTVFFKLYYTVLSWISTKHVKYARFKESASFNY